MASRKPEIIPARVSRPSESGAGAAGGVVVAGAAGVGSCASAGAASVSAKTQPNAHVRNRFRKARISYPLIPTYRPAGQGRALTQECGGSVFFWFVAIAKKEKAARRRPS